MRCVLLVLVLLAMSCRVVCAADETNHWTKIESLLGPTRSLESSPKAREYLKSLTKDQTLTALRQFGTMCEVKYPVGPKWPELQLAVMLLLEFYSEPGGGLSDEAFDKLLAGMADKKEGAFFRYALALQVGEGEYGDHLSKKQKERVIDTCLAVLHDRQAAVMVRAECGAAAARHLSKTYSRIIGSDDAVKELRRTDLERFRKVFKLIDSGKFKLAARTNEQLAPCRQRIQDLRKGLVALQKDIREPEYLKKKVEAYIYWLDRLPLIKVKELDSKPPKG